MTARRVGGVFGLCLSLAAVCPRTAHAQAPVITGPGNRTDTVGTAVVPPVAITTTGATNPLTYDAWGLPPGISVDASTGLLSGTVGAGASYAATVVSGAPAAYWRLSESSGPTAADASGHGRGLAIHGTPAFGVPGIVRDASTGFGGWSSVDYLGGGDTDAAWQQADANATPKAFTIEAIVSRTATLAWQVLVMKTNEAWTNGYGLSVGADGESLSFWVNTWDGSGDGVQVSAALTAGAFHHVAATFSGGVATLYIDGRVRASQSNVASATLDSATSALSVGWRFGGSGWSGTIDEVAFYQRALSAVEVATHAQTALSAYAVTVTASDDVAGTSSTHGFIWTVDEAPIITAPLDQVLPVGAFAPIQIVANDPEGHALTYGARGLPPGVGVGSGTGLLTGPLAIAGSPYPDQVRSRSPAAYWRFSDASGPAADASGHAGRGLTAHGQPGFGAPGVLGDASRGVAGWTFVDYLAAADADWQHRAAFSIEAVVSKGSTDPWQVLVMKSNGNAWQDGYGLSLDGTGQVLTFWLNRWSGSNGTNGAQVTADLPMGGFHHVVASYDGSLARIYVDGALLATANAGGALQNAAVTDPLRVGWHDGGQPWSGTVDELAFYESGAHGRRDRSPLRGAYEPLSRHRECVGWDARRDPSVYVDGDERHPPDHVRSESIAPCRRRDRARRGGRERYARADVHGHRTASRTHHPPRHRPDHGRAGGRGVPLSHGGARPRAGGLLAAQRCAREQRGRCHRARARAGRASGWHAHLRGGECVDRWGNSHGRLEWDLVPGGRRLGRLAGAPAVLDRGTRLEDRDEWLAGAGDEHQQRGVGRRVRPLCRRDGRESAVLDQQLVGGRRWR